MLQKERLILKMCISNSQYELINVHHMYKSIQPISYNKCPFLRFIQVGFDFYIFKMLSSKLASLLESLKKNSNIHEVQVKSAKISQQTHQGLDQNSKKLKRAKLILQKRNQLKKARLNLQNSKKQACKSTPIDLEPQMNVVVCTNNDSMNHPDSRQLMNYQIEGNNTTKYVSDLHLQQRIKEMFDSNEKQSILLEESSQKQARQQVQSDSFVSEDEDDKNPLRYFDPIDQNQEQNRIVKCYRCGKKGHLAKNCLQEKNKCIYCLKDHHHHGCNSRVCFRCNEMGHVAQECMAGWIKCHRCGKRGHVEQNCGSILFLDYREFRSDRQFRYHFKADDIKKLRCLNDSRTHNGHFNCFQYSDTKWKPYQTSDIIDTEPPYQHNTLDRDQSYNGLNIYRPYGNTNGMSMPIPEQRSGNANFKICSHQPSDYNRGANVQYRNNFKNKIYKPRQQYNRNRRW